MVLNDEPPSYLAPVQQALHALQARLQGQHQGRPAHLCSALHLLRDSGFDAVECVKTVMPVHAQLLVACKTSVNPSIINKKSI